MPGPVVPLNWTFRPNGDARRVDVDLDTYVRYVRVIYAPIDFRLYAGFGTSTPIRYIRAGESVDIWLPEPVAQLSYTWESVDDPVSPDNEASRAILIVSAGPVESSGAIASPVLLTEYDAGGRVSALYPLANSDSLLNRTRGAALVDLATQPILATVDIEQGYTFDLAPQRATRDYSTALVFGAAGRQLLMTLWNTAGNQMHADLLTVDVAMMEASAAAEVWFDLMRINTIPTGGSTYTPVERTQSASSVMAAKRIPSGGGAETGINYSSVVYKTGVTGAVSVVNPAPPILWQRLFERRAEIERPLRSVPGAGVAVVVDCNAAATVRCIARMTWQEVPV